MARCTEMHRDLLLLLREDLCQRMFILWVKIAILSFVGSCFIVLSHRRKFWATISQVVMSSLCVDSRRPLPFKEEIWGHRSPARLQIIKNAPHRHFHTFYAQKKIRTRNKTTATSNSNGAQQQQQWNNDNENENDNDNGTTTTWAHIIIAGKWQQHKRIEYLLVHHTYTDY